MKTILQLGAGKSAWSIMNYLSEHAKELDIIIKIVDRETSHIEKEFGSDRVLTIQGNIMDDEFRCAHILTSDIVISMLPARYHMQVAQDCLDLGKDLFTASYLTPELEALNEQVAKKGLLFMNEIGLDPGIDHMSAKAIIDPIIEKGGEFVSFKSYCGGLVADDYDNLWKYKFTWNPRNVVLAGQGNTMYIENGKYKYVPYHEIFKRSEKINIPGLGSFDGYYNRDSLKYREPYGLENIQTMIRGTLRKAGYAEFWERLVRLGMTDDSYKMKGSDMMTNRDFTNTFFPFGTKSVEDKFQEKFEIEDISKYKELGLFSEEIQGLEATSPAQMLQSILVNKWTLNKEDKDLVVMAHIFEFFLEGKKRRLLSYFGIQGETSSETAMAKTVGLPLAIGVKLRILGIWNHSGVYRPLLPEFYVPILEELKNYGIDFKEIAETIDT